MARKKKDAAQEAEVQEAPQEAREAPQEPQEEKAGKDTALPEITQEGGQEASVEAAGPSPAPDLKKPDPIQEAPPPPQEAKEPQEAPQDFKPYRAEVKSGILVFRLTPDGAPVGTLRRGAKVQVAARAGDFARLDNGIYVREALLRPI